MRHAPATLRNRDPILAVLRRVLPKAGTVLEIASGTGEHAVYFSGALSPLQWQPSDLSEEALASIRAHRDEAGHSNLLAPILLDVSARDATWPAADAIVCINMIHISPLETSAGLFRGGATLPPGAPLITYGPYRVDGQHTAESNARFDESLRARNPAWGIRDVGELRALAGAAFELEEKVAMPANNFTLLWRRR
ncbi:MAG: DUF938 domain-containing protein [Myxococcota bacterium]